VAFPVVYQTMLNLGLFIAGQFSEQDFEQMQKKQGRTAPWDWTWQ
jgi:hypothetical protein